MPKLEMTTSPQMQQGTRPAVTTAAAFDVNAVYPELGLSVAQVRQEIDDAFDEMKGFVNREPDEVFRLVSGHSSRLAELRGRAQRIEDRAPIWKSIRTREIEPALDELNKQFQIASRLLTVRDLDWRMETGKS